MQALLDAGTTHVLDVRDRRRFNPASNKERNNAAYMRSRGIRLIKSASWLIMLASLRGEGWKLEGTTEPLEPCNHEKITASIIDQIESNMQGDTEPVIAIVGGDAQAHNCLRSVTFSRYFYDAGQDVSHHSYNAAPVTHEELEDWMVHRYFGKASADAHEMPNTGDLIEAAYMKHTAFLLESEGLARGKRRRGRPSSGSLEEIMPV